MRELGRSRALHERASQSLAGGVSTTFRSYERPVPLSFVAARGAVVTDADGNDYVDHVCGFGPIILGHGDPEVAEAVTAAIPLQLLGGQQEREIELAERLCAMVPAFERVRFGQSGSEAVHGAIRTARAVTGRQLVVKFAGHYHGWFDGIYVATTRRGPALAESGGQPAASLADVVVLDWNDPDQLRDVFAYAGDRIAAVIMEAIVCNGGYFRPRPGYLELARDLTRAAGALLIFDEVISGFRLAPGGAQEITSVTPDLAVIAKAMGNGFPISAFGGRADVMEAVAAGRAFHAGTYCGGGVPVAAALATVTRLAAEPGIYERMRMLGQRLMSGLAAVGRRYGQPVHVSGAGPVFFLWFSESEPAGFADHVRADWARYRRFSEQLLLNGVRTIPTAGRWYLSAAHREEDVDRTLEAAERAFAALR